jgi:tetratricopeptide (TPR) repeat protein
MKPPHNQRKRKPVLIGLLVALATLVAIPLAALIALALSLLPKHWAPDHETLILIALPTLALLNAGLAIALARLTKNGPPEPSTKQIVFGDIPKEPAAFVDRSGAAELAKVFASGGGVASISTLSRVIARLKRSSTPPTAVYLTGERGTGKTQLAAQYARQAAKDGVQLVAWIPATDQGRLISELARLAGPLKLAGPGSEEKSSATCVRDYLASRDTPAAVLVLDNAEHPDTVCFWIPATGNTRVLITSTNHAFDSIGTNVPVGLYDEQEATDFLQRRTELTDPVGARTVAEELGRLPLALAQAAAFIRRHRNMDYADYLQRFRSLPLEEMLPRDHSDRYPESAARAILLSIEAATGQGAPPLAGEVMRTIALLDAAGVTRTTLASIFASRIGPDGNLDGMLADLVDASLIGWAAEGDALALVMHRLTARTIRDQLQATKQLNTTIEKTVTSLKPLLPDEQGAWAQRDRVAEIAEHANTLLNHTTTTTPQATTPEDTAIRCMQLANRCVWRLMETAQLVRSIEIATTVLADSERVLRPEHPQTLASRHSLANAYRGAGQLDKAIPIYEQTIADRERILGPDHPNTLTSRNNLAGAYRHAGHLDKAIALYEQTFADRERILGPDHLKTVTSRNNLAGAYRAADKYDKAIPLYERALADSERILGPDHLKTLTIRNNLATAYQAAEQYDKAIALHKQTLADSERILGPDHPNTTSRNNLATAYQDAGQLDKAIPIYEQTLADSERTLGPDHPKTLTIRNNLATAYQAAEQYDKAIVLHKQTLADRERTLGPDHPHTLTSRNNLATAYQDDRARVSRSWWSGIRRRSRLLHQRSSHR